MALGYVLDEVFEGHRPPSAHPERPERLAAVRAELANVGISNRARAVPTRLAREEELGTVHTAGYIAELSRSVPGNSGWLDGDTYYSEGTWDAVLSAAGGAIDLSLAVLDGELTRGLALVRPPGHHAEADRAMGFCLINNVAVAARAARDAGASRVAIVDWDVHHGNGTQHIFESDASVLYLSVHQYPFYPGTGAAEEVGVGEGVGTTVNVPMPAGSGDADYHAAFADVLIPEIRRFAPDLILLSAGFDAHADDPLASMKVTKEGYRALASKLVGVADEVSSGRLVAVLEGGYDLAALSGGVSALLDVMEQPAKATEIEHAAEPSSAVAEAIARTLSALRTARGEAQ